MFGECQGILWKVLKEMESRVGRWDRQGLFAEAVLFLGSGSHQAFPNSSDTAVDMECGPEGGRDRRANGRHWRKIRRTSILRIGWGVGSWRYFSSIAWWSRWLLQIPVFCKRNVGPFCMRPVCRHGQGQTGSYWTSVCFKSCSSPSLEKRRRNRHRRAQWPMSWACAHAQEYGWPAAVRQGMSRLRETYGNRFPPAAKVLEFELSLSGFHDKCLSPTLIMIFKMQEH